MGDCTITIHVTGAHHNGRDEDIDAMTRTFVAELKANGHIVSHAAVTNGSRETMHHVEPKRRHVEPGRHHEEHKPIGPGVPLRNDD